MTDTSTLQYHLRHGYRKVNIYRNLMSSEQYVTPMEKIMEITKTSLLLEQYTMDAAAYYYAGQRKKYNAIKQNMLPAFAPAGILSGGKARKNLRGLTGLCFLDIEHIKVGRVEAAMAALKDNPLVLFAARSLSGHGLHIFVPYIIIDNEPGEVPRLTPMDINKEYYIVFQAIASHFSKMLNLTFCRHNAESLCVVSYDANAITNLNAVPVRIEYEYYDKTITNYE